MDSLGHVRAGYPTEFVLLDVDPTADIEAIREIPGLILGGPHYDRAELDPLAATPRSR